MYKKYYKNFLETHKGKLHLAAHSHHFWPDITRDAVIKSWDDSAKYSDKKWEYIFTNIVPKAQSHIANILNLSHPEQIAFAPNTHELLSRLLSCFSNNDSFEILTTTSEFHSFSRQLKRLLELPNISAIIIDNESPTFEEDFLSHVKNADFIFISHVFYNSGKVLSFSFLNKIIEHKKDKSILCLDGYHGFCAIETDLSKYENDIFYLAGGYKYAQAGEGACFMVCPKDTDLRPLNTGWFASFSSLDIPQEKIDYANNGMRFWGATQDLTPLYRFNYVWDQFFNDEVSIKKIDHYIKKLQIYFIENFEKTQLLINTNLDIQGHFLTLELSSHKLCEKLHGELEKNNILTDFRANRLRFGFGLYLETEDLKQKMKTINQIVFQVVG